MIEESIYKFYEIVKSQGNRICDEMIDTLLKGGLIFESTKNTYFIDLQVTVHISEKTESFMGLPSMEGYVVNYQSFNLNSIKNLISVHNISKIKYIDYKIDINSSLDCNTRNPIMGSNLIKSSLVEWSKKWGFNYKKIVMTDNNSKYSIQYNSVIKSFGKSVPRIMKKINSSDSVNENMKKFIEFEKRQIDNKKRLGEYKKELNNISIGVSNIKLPDRDRNKLLHMIVSRLELLKVILKGVLQEDNVLCLSDGDEYYERNIKDDYSIFSHKYKIWNFKASISRFETEGSRWYFYYNEYDRDVKIPLSHSSTSDYTLYLILRELDKIGVVKNNINSNIFKKINGAINENIIREIPKIRELKKSYIDKYKKFKNRYLDIKNEFELYQRTMRSELDNINYGTKSDDKNKLVKIVSYLIETYYKKSKSTEGKIIFNSHSNLKLGFPFYQLDNDKEEHYLIRQIFKVSNQWYIENEQGKCKSLSDSSVFELIQMFDLLMSIDSVSTEINKKSFKIINK